MQKTELDRLAIGLMIVVSKATSKTVPADARMKMLENERRQALNAHQQNSPATTQVDPDV